MINDSLSGTPKHLNANISVHQIYVEDKTQYTEYISLTKKIYITDMVKTVYTCTSASKNCNQSTIPKRVGSAGGIVPLISCGQCTMVAKGSYGSWGMKGK